MITLLDLLGCSSPESLAGEVALKYASLPPDDAVSRHLLACADDREAKPVEALKADLAAGEGLFGALLDQAAALGAKATRRVQTTTLNATRDAGSVVISVSLAGEGGSTLDSTRTVEVRAEGDGWCVVTGWAEQKRLDGIAADAEARLENVAALVKDWKLDEAGAEITAAEATLNGLPESDPRRTALDRNLKEVREALDTLKIGWVGGRWRVQEERDPMTDHDNVVVTLQSVEGLPNSIGQEKPASVIFRCRRGRLDAYVATNSMLDSNWRTDSVSGQHRFGSDPAERLSGGVSTDRQAMFLRNPRAWMDRFREREADGWTVELPLYNRVPASVRFDLASAGAALKAIPDSCR